MIITGDIFLENKNFKCKFIRIGNEIYITSPDDLTTLHIELAKREKILQRIQQLKEQDINQVDGGIFFVSGKMIWVGGASSSLGLPETSKARALTIKRLGDRFPSLSARLLGE